mmetsp:Transcript_23591/g.80425  ORF Transcript_23591/g.80425 Transcript_23591/m.80425 type:complete len:351 (-) Transcript_23591:625-1677(-)
MAAVHTRVAGREPRGVHGRGRRQAEEVPSASSRMGHVCLHEAEHEADAADAGDTHHVQREHAEVVRPARRGVPFRVPVREPEEAVLLHSAGHAAGTPLAPAQRRRERARWQPPPPPGLRASHGPPAAPEGAHIPQQDPGVSQESDGAQQRAQNGARGGVLQRGRHGHRPDARVLHPRVPRAAAALPRPVAHRPRAGRRHGRAGRPRGRAARPVPGAAQVVRRAGGARAQGEGALPPPRPPRRQGHPGRPAHGPPPRASLLPPRPARPAPRHDGPDRGGPHAGQEPRPPVRLVPEEGGARGHRRSGRRRQGPDAGRRARGGPVHELHVPGRGRAGAQARRRRLRGDHRQPA